MTKKVTPKPKNTQIRVTTASAGMVQKLAKELFKGEQEAHVKMGLSKPSSRLAIDYMIYMCARNGIGSWPELTEKNNLYMLLIYNSKEE